jgi:regulator of sigma E protease
MDVLVMIFQVLLALSILIILHEWGHFITARMFGIRVEKFYLFFDAWGKKLFSFKKGDCEYGVGWLPLGGYVKISGMIDESMDKEQMKEEPKDYEFRSKPAWQRLIVMLGGVTVNVILGILIFWFITFFYGEKSMPMSAVNDGYGIKALTLGEQVGFQDGDKILAINGKEFTKFEDVVKPKNLIADKLVYNIERNGEHLDLTMPEGFINLISTVGKDSGFISYRSRFKIGEVSPKSNAMKAGLKKGDQIIEMNGKPINYYQDFVEMVDSNLEVSLVVLRDGAKVNLEGQLDENGIFGFMPDNFEMAVVKYGFWEALPVGVNRGVETIALQVEAFGKMFEGKIDARKNVMGPLQLGKVFGGNLDWYRFWNLTALFSLVLAIMNLLPIPALDGGHAMFLVVEMVRRKPLSDKFMQTVQVIGMFILFALMALIFGNDILRLMGI